MTLDLLRSLAKHGTSNIEEFFLGPIYIYMKMLVFMDIIYIYIYENVGFYGYIKKYWLIFLHKISVR